MYDFKVLLERKLGEYASRPQNQSSQSGPEAEAEASASRQTHARLSPQLSILSII